MRPCFAVVCVVLGVVQLGTLVSSTPIADAEGIRSPRQVGECCPCDQSGRNSWSDQDKAADSSGVGSLADDCPCRGRSADSDGAASILFPNAVRAIRPFLKTGEPKKDLKPLLSPEVDLASSVLTTLKEVTDEDYREALARDAARNAAKALERDAHPEESAPNVVTIVLDPHSDMAGDDILAQPSHNQETLCIQPLENARSTYKTSKRPSVLDSLWSPSNVKPIINQPKFLKYSDSNDDASNVHETEYLRPRAILPNSRFENILGRNSDKNNREDSECFDKISPKSVAQNNLASNLDAEGSATNTEERLAKSPQSGFGEIISRPIKNLLKLRDVELLPKNVFAERKLAKPQDLLPSVDFKDLKEKLSHLRIPNLIEKLKRKKPNEPQNNKAFGNKDNGEAASNIQEQVMALPNSAITGIQNVPDLRDLKWSPTETVDQKYKDPSRISPIPNLLEGLKLKRPQKDPEAHFLKKVDNYDKKKLDFMSKLEELRKNSKLRMINRNRFPQLNLSGKQINPRTKSDKDSNSFTQPQIVDNCNQEFKENPQTQLEQDDIPHTKILDSPLENTPIINNEFSNQPEEHNPIGSSNTFEPEEDLTQTKFVQDDGPETKILDSVTSPSENTPTVINELNNQPEAHNSNGNLNAFESEADFTETNVKSNLGSNEELSENNQLDYVNVADSRNYNIGNSDSNIGEMPDLTIKNDDEDTSDVNRASVKSSATENLPVTLSNKSQIQNEKQPLNEQSQEVFQMSREPVSNSIKAHKDNEDDLNLDHSVFDNAPIDDPQPLSDKIIEPSNDLRNVEKEDIQVSDSSDYVDEKNISDDANSESRNLISGSNNNENSITMHDLQQLSDSLLDQSNQETRLSEPIFSAPHSSEDGGPIREKNMIPLHATKDMDSTSRQIEGVIKEKNINNKDNACISDLVSEKRNDASAEASESYMQTVSSPMRRMHSDGGVSSLFDSPRSSLNDIRNLKQNLPTLGEIHSRISNALNPTPIPSIENFPRKIIDRKPNSIARQLKSTRPKYSSEPLEVDIFQMNPASSTQSHLARNFPRLNLDSFKTKLAMPQSSGIKPLKLESAIGDKRGMVGTTLLFGSDKQRDLINSASTPFIDRLRESNLFKRPIVNLPTLEDLKTSMREHFDDLFNPEARSSLGSNSISSLTDSFRSKAEDRVKNIHNTLESSLKRAKEAGSNILGNAYAKPNNLLEEMAQRHEDLTDKLKGIHYDLNDRITSLHDEIVEKTNLPRFDLFQPKDVEQFDIIPKTYNQKPIVRKVIKRPVKSKDLVKSRMIKEIVTRRPLERSRPSKLRMASSASVPVPKSIQAPQLTKTDNHALLHPLIRQAKPEITQQRIPTDINNQRVYGSDRRTDAKVLQSGPNFVSQSKSVIDQPTLRSKPFRTSNVNNLKLLKDSNIAPSERVISKTPSVFSNFEKQRSQTRSLLKPESPSDIEQTALKRTTIPLKEKIVKQSRRSEDVKKSFDIPNLAWPQTTENSFLNKVREALRARLDNAKLKTVTPKKTISKIINNVGIKDMERSASTNVKIVNGINEPIREKTSYKCKMICSRDSAEIK